MLRTRGAGAVPVLVLLALVFWLRRLGSTSEFDLAGFTGWPVSIQRHMLGHSCREGTRHAVSRRVRERRKGSRDPASRGAPYPMVLTSKIKNSTSSAELLSLLEKEVDGAVFNDFHMSATFTRLAFFKRSRRLPAVDARSPLWPRLTARLQTMLVTDLISPRVASNVLWALVEIHQDIGMHMASAVPALVRHVQDNARSMNAFDLSNCIWAVASLHDAEPKVLKAVSAIVENIPRQASEFVPQALSNSLWAAAKLQEAAPDVLTAVPAVAERMPQKVESLKPQELSNSLWAAAKLQDAAPDVLMTVPALAETIPRKVEIMNPQALSNSLWAAAKLQDAAPDVLMAVPAIVEHITQMVESMIPQALSNILWAAAKLQDSAPDVLMAVPAVVERIPQVAESMNPQEVSNSLWAAANL